MPDPSVILGDTRASYRPQILQTRPQRPEIARLPSVGLDAPASRLR